MRFVRKTYEEGGTREKSWFAILPVTIDKETRWLEKVSVIQTYVWSYPLSKYYWSNREFLDKE